MNWFGFNKNRESTPGKKHTADGGFPPGHPDSATSNATSDPSSPPRILVIIDPPENEPASAIDLESLKPQWNCLRVHSGQQALELAAAQKFDAVLGRDRDSDVLRRIHTLHPHVIRVLHGGPDSVVAKSEHGGLPPFFLVAPFEPGDLESTLDRAARVEHWMGTAATRALLARMENLPATPTLYARVMFELKSDNPSIDGVAALIAKDPALTARMLQAVNSPIFALRRPVGTAFEAVTFLGAERTKALILMASLSLHGNQTPCEGFSHDNFWHHSLSVATWARSLALAEMKSAAEADLAFTAGILHDIGKVLFAANLPVEYGATLTEAREKGVTTHQVEEEKLTISHGCLGASLLGTWGLPMPILEAIAWHNCPGKSDDRSFSILTAVHVANALEYERKAVESAGAVSVLDESYLERLGINALVDRWRQLIGCPPRPRTS